MRGPAALSALALALLFLLLLPASRIIASPRPPLPPPRLAPTPSSLPPPTAPPLSAERAPSAGLILSATLPDSSRRLYRLENATWGAVRAGDAWTAVLTCLGASNDSYFYARLLGPAIVVGATRNLGAARYALDFRPPDAGAYRLELVLSFLSADQAFPSGSVAHRGCLCAPLDGAIPRLLVLPASTALSPPPPPAECAAGAWPEGRWLQAPLRWAPFGCTLRRLSAPALAACLAARRPLLVGDSHLRVLRDSLAHAAVAWHPVKGVYNASRSPAYFTDLAERPARRPVLREWLQSAAGAAALGAAGAVLFEAGQWDLRDWSVAQFLADVAEALAAWPPPPPGQRRVLVTAPAYSYGQARFGAREYRTLEKMEQANAALGSLFAAAGWERADWWALSRPLHRATCDTHHFLCPHNGTHSPVGLAMLDTFAHQLCTP